MNPQRTRTIKDAPAGSGPVVYWMSRDQRARDNWALLHAQALAMRWRRPLVVVFCLVPRFLDATIRQYGFMLKGLQELEQSLEEKCIPFCLLTGRPEQAVPMFARRHKAACVATDFSPLRIKGEWLKAVAERVDCPLHEVDAHNIVPCWAASPKREHGAYTLRPKLHRALPEFLDEFPPLRKHPIAWEEAKGTDWRAAARSLEVDQAVPEVDWLVPGEKAARAALHCFVKTKLARYPSSRNDPAQDGQSDLSPYLHFGQLSAQRVALDVNRARVSVETKEAFLEELIVRRELSDNFCFYNRQYDSFEAFPPWAGKTLDAHRKDRREYVYDFGRFERAETHDDLWNAAQTEMVRRGKMHGYMRMYWCKKILEWSRSPEEALRIAIHLNDKYELDGRDPNGYAGIAWSIGGVHDRPWGERRVFGMVRYMSYNGCKSKFDVRAYIARVHEM